MSYITDPEKLRSDLSAFSEIQNNHVQKLETVLQDYMKLIEAYCNLKSDYEEARDSREKYKRIAKDCDKNPFVLVLIDGDGYVFKDQFIRDRDKGGVEAAQELHKQIQAHLSALGNEVARSRIMVRIYANLKGLSQTLARVGLCGNESRSLAPFACSFTRAQELFDFIDAGEGKERADFKINEMFRLFIDNPQCKHIFFAGCHDSGYVNTLTPYAKSAAERLTLVRGSYFSDEFKALGLQVLEFPTVFRSTPLENGMYNSKDNVKVSRTVGALASSITTAKPKAVKKLCPYYRKGTCWRGETCNFLHETAINGDAEAATLTESNDFDVAADSDAIVASNDASAHSEISSSTMAQIPVDKSGSRIDFLPEVSSADMAAYYARVNEKKLCNDHFLTGCCTKENCPYDHSKVAPSIVNALRYVVRSKMKCPKGAQCRSRTCYKGHISSAYLSGSDRFEYEWVPAED